MLYENYLHNEMQGICNLPHKIESERNVVQPSIFERSEINKEIQMIHRMYTYNRGIFGKHPQGP